MTSAVTAVGEVADRAFARAAAAPLIAGNAVRLLRGAHGELAGLA